MFFSNLHKSFAIELTINTLLFVLFETYALHQLATSQIASELAFSFVFSLIMFAYFVLWAKTNEKVKHFEFELMNHTFFIINVMFTIALILNWINLNIFIPLLEMENAYISNIILQTIIYFKFLTYFFNYEEYLVSAKNNTLIKNAFFHLIKSKKVAYPSILIEKDNLEKERLISHEAGHLLFILEEIDEEKAVTASIIKDNFANGFVLFNVDHLLSTKENLEKVMKFYLGGIIAEIYEENQNEGIKQSVGRQSDMEAFNKVAIKYLNNAYSIHENTINYCTKQDQDAVIAFNDKSFRNLHKRMLLEGMEYLLENKESYENIKNLLRNKGIIYTKDVLTLKKAVNKNNKLESKK